MYCHIIGSIGAINTASAISTTRLFSERVDAKVDPQNPLAAGDANFDLQLGLREHSFLPSETKDAL